MKYKIVEKREEERKKERKKLSLQSKHTQHCQERYRVPLRESEEHRYNVSR